MIFWTLSGSLAAAIYYDKWQTKRVKDKWCKLVSPIADEPLDIRTLPRTVTVYLSAPPGDGLRAAREHFHNYVKPILVAGALNWDVIEGRKEGDVRYKTAQSIRDRRKKLGEQTTVPLKDSPIEAVRQGFGVEDSNGVAGDLIVGRHTYKEYIRGLHEGWLGPVDAPVDTIEQPSSLETSATDPPKPASEAVADSTSPSADASVQPTSEEIPPTPDTEPKKQEEEIPKPRFPPPYITPDNFSSANPPRSIPETLDPVAPISCPHLLGFRNTPIRFYRFLTRRNTADEIGRQVASAVLGHNRAFTTATEGNASLENEAEQSIVLQKEERDWWKTVRVPRKEHEESVLIEPVALNEQITSRMRIFELTAEDEDRSKRVLSAPSSDVTGRD